ncbi:MAG: hypothetical protein AAGK14_10145 [Verrucomicrobiota bacterium]
MERKLLTILCWLVVAATLLHTHKAFAEEPVLKEIKDSIAEAFSYPAAGLTISKKNAPRGTLAYIIESEDVTFFPVRIDIGNRGRLLKPQFETQLEKALEITSKLEEKSTIRKISLGGQGYAYLGIGAGGPGGSQSGAVFVFPESQLEVAITVISSREDNINIKEAPQEYQALMSKNKPDMVSRITRLAKQMVAFIDHNALEKSVAPATQIPVSETQSLSP